MSDEAPFRLTAAELAARTGLTERTLHHYDRIGLLRPATRGPEGDGLYGGPELRRLQHIASLRRLGSALDDVRRHLAGDGPDDSSLAETLDSHLARFDGEIRADVARWERLRSLRARIARTDDEPTLDEWTTTISDTLRFERAQAFDAGETPIERPDDMGLSRLAEVEAQWIEIFHELGDAVDAGLSPTHPRVAALARQARALISEFTTDDAGSAHSSRAMLESEGARPLTDRGIHMRRDVWAFLGSAMEAERTTNED